MTLIAAGKAYACQCVMAFGLRASLQSSDCMHPRTRNTRKMWLGRRIALLTITLSPLAFSPEISCKVVTISDGDTFTCLDASRSQIKVRMANIDTPEGKQPYGQKAKQELSELLFGKYISLEAEAKTGTGALSGMPMLTAYMPTEKWLPGVPLGCIANTTAINP